MPTTAVKFNFLTTHPVKVYPSVHDMYHRNDQRLEEVGPGEYEIVDRGRDFDLLDLSDKAMYRSKSLGRNRTCSANELTL